MLYLSQVKACSIRNLGEFEISPGKRLNFFYGSNASGKTSILETICLLSRVKSFRSKRINDVISKGKNRLQVFAKGMNGIGSFTLGVEKGHGITRLKFNDNLVPTASEQAKKLPLFLLTTEHAVLFTGTPKERRRWLDWSLFHVKQDYLSVWKDYYRAMRHRNALLKNEVLDSGREIDGWERIMKDEAIKLDSMRESYLSDLDKRLNQTFLKKVMPGTAVISYQKGDYETDKLDVILAENREHDNKKGFTYYGPHRSDVCFSYNDFYVARHLSRGQVKLYGAALISSQIENLKHRGINALVLVDDLDAELDKASSRKILELLLLNESQTFISSLELPDLDIMDENIKTLFHVKQGNIEKHQHNQSTN